MRDPLLRTGHITYLYRGVVKKKSLTPPLPPSFSVWNKIMTFTTTGEGLCCYTCRSIMLPLWCIYLFIFIWMLCSDLRLALMNRPISSDTLLYIFCTKKFILNPDLIPWSSVHICTLVDMKDFEILCVYNVNVVHCTKKLCNLFLFFYCFMVKNSCN